MPPLGGGMEIIMRKLRFKGIVALFLCFTFIIFSVLQVKAEKPTIEIKNGKLIFSTIDTKATSNIRWKTVGFTVTRYDSDGNPIQDKNKNGKKDDYAQLWLVNGEKQEQDIGNGQVRVTFTISEDTINKAFESNDLDKIQENDTIYLSGIFAVMHGSVEQPGYYYTLNDIKSAEDWANKDDFADHFDIPATWETTYTYPVSVERWLYSSSGNIKYDTKSYDEQKKNTTFKTDSNKIKASISANGNTYYLYRVYYINLRKPGTKEGNRKIETNPNVSLSQYENDIKYLRDREFTVKDKGLKIVAMYRRFNEYNPDENKEIMKRDFEMVDPIGLIGADTRGDELFEVTEGIPGTESLYVNALTSKYLSAYQFTRIYGKKVYSVTVKKTYTLNWTTTTTVENPVTKEKTEVIEKHTEVEEVPKTYIVEREYSYWAIDSLAVYGLDKAIINNAALPGGSIILNPTGYNLPTVSYTQSENEKDHLKEPEIKIITMPGQTITGTGLRPSVPVEDFKVKAEESVKKIKCKNDKLIFNGQTIMSDSENEEKTEDPKDIPEGQEEIGENVLFKSGLAIPATMANAEYETTGTVKYKPIVEFHDQTETDYEIAEINAVVVHTPTVCDAQIQNNISDNQMLTPDKSRASLVLDRPFLVTLSTTGNHRYIKGYGYNDYGKYIESRQVSFPFGVYRGSSYSGTYIPANTWTSVAENTQFFLPAWVNEGKYTVSFRSTAINAHANNKTGNTETLANLSLSNYVATDTVHVEISGR
ncbi:MAG: DUF5704 domain-containing protein, partial [Anaerocolumna sp.]